MDDMSLALLYVWQAKGLIHRVTCLYTSEQNGILKSRKRRVLEKGLKLMFQASLPSKLWIHTFKKMYSPRIGCHLKCLMS